MMQPYIRLEFGLGRYGEKVSSLVLPISGELQREMTETVDLSNDVTSLLVEGFRPGRSAMECISETVQRREKVFKFRKDTAKAVGEMVEAALLKHMGEGDTVDGWPKNDAPAPTRRNRCDR